MTVDATVLAHLFASLSNHECNHEFKSFPLGLNPYSREMELVHISLIKDGVINYSHPFSPQ